MLTFLYDKMGRRWRWWLKHRNGKIMAYGRHRGYARKEDCINAIIVMQTISECGSIIKQGRP